MAGYNIDAGQSITIDSSNSKNAGRTGEWTYKDVKHFLNGNFGATDAEGSDGSIKLSKNGKLTIKVPIYAIIGTSDSGTSCQYNSKTIDTTVKIGNFFNIQGSSTYTPYGYKKIDTIDVECTIPNFYDITTIPVTITFSTTSSGGTAHTTSIKFDITCYPIIEINYYNNDSYWYTQETNGPCKLMNLDEGEEPYYLFGWKINNTIYSPNADFTPSAYSYEAVAVWKPRQSNIHLKNINNDDAYNFIVTYDSTDNSTKNINYSPSGFTFYGWYLYTDGYGDFFGDNCPRAGEYWQNLNNNLYWNYYERKKQVSELIFYPYLKSAVIYSSDFGTYTETVQFTHGNQVTVQSKPSGVDSNLYRFDGWYSNNTKYSPGELLKDYNEYHPNLYLTAHWTRLTATVTYNANGHGQAPEPQTISYSSAAYFRSMNNVMGYEFKGWATSPTGTVVYNAGDKIKDANVVPEDMTLYAVWEKIAFFGRGRIGDNWKYGIVYFKHNGHWKISPYGYVKVNGEWKLIE